MCPIETSGLLQFYHPQLYINVHLFNVHAQGVKIGLLLLSSIQKIAKSRYLDILGGTK